MLNYCRLTKINEPLFCHVFTGGDDNGKSMDADADFLTSIVCWDGLFGLM